MCIRITWKSGLSHRCRAPYGLLDSVSLGRDPRACIFIYLFIYFWLYPNLVLARQAVYYLSHAPALGFAFLARLLVVLVVLAWGARLENQSSFTPIPYH
jgi:hypothetical protein